MNSVLRIIFLIYFITHIPITICIDSQALFKSYYPQELQDFHTWYITSYNDVVFAQPQPWLQSFIYCELLFQFPFFFFVTWGLLKKKNNIRIPSIVYGAHVSTTLVPIMLEIWSSDQMTHSQKVTLLGVYSPYLIIPFILMVYMSIHTNIFDPEAKKVK